MIKKIAILFITFLSGFTSLCQTYPKKIVIESDTCIAFSIEQSKTLILWNTQKKECYELSDIYRMELDVKDTIILEYRNKTLVWKEIEQKYEAISVEKDELLEYCEIEKTAYKSEAKRQKRRKILSIGVGILSTSFMTYLWIVK